MKRWFCFVFPPLIVKVFHTADLWNWLNRRRYRWILRKRIRCPAMRVRRISVPVTPCLAKKFHKIVQLKWTLHRILCTCNNQWASDKVCQIWILIHHTRVTIPCWFPVLVPATQICCRPVIVASRIRRLHRRGNCFYCNKIFLSAITNHCLTFRATLRRGFAFSSSIKNPPLVKSRNVISQNSFNILTGVPQPSSSTSSLSGQLGSRAPSPASLQHINQTQVPHQQRKQNTQTSQQQQQQQPSNDIEQQIPNSNESDVWQLRNFFVNIFERLSF